VDSQHSLLKDALGIEGEETYGGLIREVEDMAQRPSSVTVTSTLVEDLAVALGHAPPAHPTDYSEATLLSEVRKLRRPKPCADTVAQERELQHQVEVMATELDHAHELAEANAAAARAGGWRAGFERALELLSEQRAAK